MKCNTNIIRRQALILWKKAKLAQRVAAEKAKPQQQQKNLVLISGATNRSRSRRIYYHRSRRKNQKQKLHSRKGNRSRAKTARLLTKHRSRKTRAATPACRNGECKPTANLSGFWDRAGKREARKN